MKVKNDRVKVIGRPFALKFSKSDEGLKPSELRAVPRLNTKNTGVLYGGSLRFYHFLAATREMAFIQAISAAAITHEIAHQCTQNKIPGCECPLPSPSWSKCGDYVSFGEKKSRPFTDSLKKRRDAQTVVYLHNNAVGREVTHLLDRFSLSRNKKINQKLSSA